MPNTKAVLLLAHGTPETLDQIPEYLRNITGGAAHARSRWSKRSAAVTVSLARAR